MKSSFFTMEAAEFLTIFTFLFIVLLSFLKYVLFQNHPDNRDVQKIIGGLSVFIVAILSQSWQVSAISLLIGGLIIASEEFMEKLAIILRSESKDIGTNLSYTKAEPKDVTNKLKDEVGEQAGDLRQANRASTHVFAYFKQQYNDLFEPEVKISSEGKELVVDGIIKTEANTISSIVEVRYVQHQSAGKIRDLIIETKKRIQTVLPDQHITFCIVAKEAVPNLEGHVPENISLFMFKLKRGGVDLVYSI